MARVVIRNHRLGEREPFGPALTHSTHQRVTITSVPTFTRSNRSTMSSLNMRMHPYVAKVPMEYGRFVPWMAYCSPPDSVSARGPMGFVAPPRDDVRQPRVIAPDLVRGCPGRVDVLSVHLGAALPLFAGPADSNRITDRPAVPEDVVELAILRANDDCSRPLGTCVSYELACEFRLPVRERRLAPECRERVREVAIRREFRRSSCVAGRNRYAGDGDNKKAS